MPPSAHRAKGPEKSRRMAKKSKAAVSRFMQGAADFLRAQMDKVLAAVILGAVTALGFWLTPLKDIILQRLYPERAEVSLIADRNSIAAGQPVQLQIKIAQQSTFPVSKGVIRLHFDPTILVLSPESTPSLNTDVIAGAAVLEKHFVLFGREGRAAKTQLHATLETKFDTYSSPALTVELLQRRESTAPYIEQHGSQAINLSGEWHIEIGGVHGTMKIAQDSKNNITGSYRLTGGGTSEGTIEGYKDGTSFKVFFYRGTENTRRWRVDSNFAINPTDKRFVEIKGCAYSIQKDSRISEDSPVELGDKSASCARPRNYVGWRGVGASTFYATAQMQR
jgi:hypothetical protein